MLGRNGWPFRIVVMDASREERDVIKDVLQASTDMAVVGEASDRAGGTALIETLAPDAVVIGPSCSWSDATKATKAFLSQAHVVVVGVRAPGSTRVKGVWAEVDGEHIDRLPGAIRRSCELQSQFDPGRSQ